MCIFQCSIHASAQFARLLYRPSNIYNLHRLYTTTIIISIH